MITEVRSLWPVLLPMIEKLCDYSGKYGPEDVWNDYFHDRCQFWTDDVDNPSVIVITKIIEYSKAKVLQIDGCAGTGLNGWIGMIGGLEKFGRFKGCSSVEISGRLGWQRILKDYEVTRIRLDKAL